ncbi:MAG: hypothetical protein JWN44_3579 [Myxococcales bacterium]|nr:hypothetical protein [Myxococcales bacterium]
MLARILTGLFVVGLMMATVVGCHDKKNDSTTPAGMSDAGTAPAYPPAQ